MSFIGTVTKDGTITVPPEAKLSEGTQVRVVPVSPQPDRRPIGRKLLELAGSIDGLPADFAATHDHHLHDKVPVESAATKAHTLHDELSEFVGVIDDLPPDFALNHDHYIHGTPKRKE